MKLDVMIDLETLGPTPGSVILSIGAATAGREFYGKIDLRDSLYAGLSVDPETLAWWRKQSQDAWRASAVAGPEASIVLRYVLGEFRDWIEILRKDAAPAHILLWGDSAGFDLGLLAAEYRAVGLPLPWRYTEERCYRTLRAFLKSDKPASKLAHDGLADAKAQLAHLQEMKAALSAAGITLE